MLLISINRSRAISRCGGVALARPKNSCSFRALGTLGSTSMRLIRTGMQMLAILVLSAGSALAQSDMQFAGTVGAGWTDFLLPAKTAHASEWLVDGSAVLTLNNPGFNFQVNGNNN